MFGYGDENDEDDGEGDSSDDEKEEPSKDESPELMVKGKAMNIGKKVDKQALSDSLKQA